MKITPSMCTITCKCGHEADFMEFKQTPVNGDLPDKAYQCPECQRAWELQIGPPKLGWSGLILPGDTSVVVIPSTM